VSEERLLLGLRPELRDKYVQLRDKCAEEGIRIKLVQGRRTDADQRALYALGRSTPGIIVTEARTAAETPHGIGAAFDIAIFDGDKISWTEPRMTPKYVRVGEIGESIGLDWGGRFKKPDKPHFQLPNWKALR